MKIQPIIILQTDSMSKQDIKRSRQAGFCVVESKAPSFVRFLDAPLSQDYSVHERAAIELSRTLIKTGAIPGYTYNFKMAIGSLYADILLAGDPLKRVTPGGEPQK